MSKNNLKITADREDYAVGLKSYLNVNGFSGYGEGWFNNSDIKEFCSKLSSISVEMEGEAELLGTEKRLDGSDYLETMCIRVYVLCASKLNGIVGVHITLSERPSSDSRAQEILKMSGELKVRNRLLGVFSSDLQDLMNGGVNEINMVGDLKIF